MNADKDVFSLLSMKNILATMGAIIIFLAGQMANNIMNDYKDVKNTTYATKHDLELLILKDSLFRYGVEQTISNNQCLIDDIKNKQK